ncbi:hypothetical protein NDU88_002675 [Pleurodeles waltl]|uniref:Uncharacterized protein n=1 Tax=Pleurodeles waltl TaxID=8319 RepID=A0AAV7QDD2_PLEWA|nr:hypothetical protein NDU88_002675 [Pleurodeles waltl]
MALGVCDGLARCGRSVNTTCAGAGGTNPAQKDVTANPRELPASKEEPGGLRGRRGQMKRQTAERRGAAEVAGVRENGYSKGDRNQEPGGKCPNIFAVSSRRRRGTAKLPATLHSGASWNRLRETRVVGRGEEEDASGKGTKD